MPIRTYARMPLYTVHASSVPYRASSAEIVMLTMKNPHHIPVTARRYGPRLASSSGCRSRAYVSIMLGPRRSVRANPISSAPLTSTRTRSGACRVELLVGQVDDVLHRLDPLQLVLGDLQVHLLLEADRKVDEVEAVELQVVDQARGGDDLLVPQLEALDEQVA